MFDVSRAPSADRTTAILRKPSKRAQIIAVITMMGTERNMPGIPQIMPQKVSDRTIMNELRFSDLPMKAGSITLPTINWTVPRPTVIRRKGVSVSNCTRVSKKKLKFNILPQQLLVAY